MKYVKFPNLYITVINFFFFVKLCLKKTNNFLKKKNFSNKT